jgi:hypothetical protein
MRTNRHSRAAITVRADSTVEIMGGSPIRRTVVKRRQRALVAIKCTLFFLQFCRTFLSGGTRIRTGETMIFSHVPRPLGMQQNCLGKRITVYRVSLDIAWCRRYCCPTIARPRHEHRELFLWRGSAGRLLSERSKGATLSSHGRGERTLLRAPVGEII